MKNKKILEEIWSKNKYLVLSKSHKIYLEIRDYLKNEDVEKYVLEEMIEKAKLIPDDKGQFINVIEHVWGYFKKNVSENEKETFLRYIKLYKNNDIKKEDIIDYIRKLLIKYPNEYIENSTLIGRKLDFIIKECKLEYLEDLQSISKITFEETFGNQNTKEDLEKYFEENYNIEKLKEDILDENSKIYLAYSNDEILGYIKFNLEASQTEKGYDNSLEIQRIYVKKSAKGMGIGKKFLEISEGYARENNLEYIWLGVWEKNYDAIKFYESKGFERFSEHIFVLGHDKQIDYLMKKSLIKI